MIPKSQRSKPRVTLSSVKSLMVPIFDKIFVTAPGSAAGSQYIDNSAYMEVYNACFDYSTRGITHSKSSPEPKDPSTIVKKEGLELDGQRNVTGKTDELTEDEFVDEVVKRGSSVGYDFYQFIDDYFKQKAKEIASGVVLGDEKAQALKCILQKFTHYEDASRLIARMLVYFDRYYIKMVNESGAGWMRGSDLDFEVVPNTEEPPENEPFTQTKAYMQKLHEHLVKWGYTDDENGRISRDDAIDSAQAASSQDRVIHIHPLAMRRFRTEVVEPLIMSSDEMIKWVKHNLMSSIQEVVDGEFNAMTTEFREMLRRVGVLEQDLFK